MPNDVISSITIPVNGSPVTYDIKDAAARTAAGNAATLAFKTIAANETNIVADSKDDTVTFSQGDKIKITGAASTDTITFAHDDSVTAVPAGLYEVGTDKYGHVVLGNAFTIPAGVSPYTSNPAMDGSASAGSSDKFARGDHVHPTDTSRAPLASPTFTGTPKAPTATAGTNTTQIATTAFVKTAVDNAVSGAVVFKGTQTSVSAIKALTNVKQGWMYIVSSSDDDNGQEWVATADIGSTADATKWEMLGTLDVGDLGALAYKDSGSVTLTPGGSVSGSVTVGSTNVYEITGVGSMPTYSVTNEVLTITAGSAPTRSQKTVGASGAATTSLSFSGTEQTVSVVFS